MSIRDTKMIVCGKCKHGKRELHALHRRKTEEKKKKNSEKGEWKKGKSKRGKVRHTFIRESYVRARATTHTYTPMYAYVHRYTGIRV